MVSTSPKPETTATESAGQPIFIAHNTHVESAGEPPQVVDDGDADKYAGFFVDEAGDQFILEIDLNKSRAVLRGGDLRWTTETVIDGDEFPSDVIIDDDTRAWLRACWRAAVGRKLVL